MKRRSKRFIALALRESLSSDYARIQIGAVITDGNFVVAKAANRKASHPLQFYYNRKFHRGWSVKNKHSCHAEMLALVRSKDYDLTTCEIFIARLDRSGNMAMCRPCSACEGALRDAGITTITYTTSKGIVEEKL